MVNIITQYFMGTHSIKASVWALLELPYGSCEKACSNGRSSVSVCLGSPLPLRQPDLVGLWRSKAHCIPQQKQQASAPLCNAFDSMNRALNVNFEHQKLNNHSIHLVNAMHLWCSA